MTGFAKNTTVPVSRTQADITKLLSKYGAQSYRFAYNADPGAHLIEFAFNGFLFRFILLEAVKEEFLTGRSGRRRTPAQIRSAIDQANRQKWRALHLIIKAKFEYIAGGFSSVEQEFLSNVVPLDAKERTIGEMIIPNLMAGKPLKQIPRLQKEESCQQ